MAFQLGGDLLRRLIGVGIAVAIGIGWWSFSSFKAKADAPDVGDCVTVGGTTTDADVDEVDCGGDDVLYKVTGDDGDCDINEVNYTVSVKGSDAVDLCLDWDVESGDCVKVGIDKDEKVDCAATKGDSDVVKVISVAEGADGTCATKRELARPNVKRDVLVCVGPNS